LTLRPESGPQQRLGDYRHVPLRPAADIFFPSSLGCTWLPPSGTKDDKKPKGN
jgi:hypothetical protein